VHFFNRTATYAPQDKLLSVAKVASHKRDAFCVAYPLGNPLYIKEIIFYFS